jgi:ppGpp synthetase/RelA/SpoT-type nucleotidyltranferase
MSPTQAKTGLSGPPAVEEDEDFMDWVTPQFSRGEVDRAGAILASDEPWEYPAEEYYHALEVINNWRSSHSRPLYTFRFGVRRHAERIDPNALVAQRIKRLSSIRLKLTLSPNMKLSQMQDIGGCRAVVEDVKKVNRLVENYKSSDIKHKLIGQDDYIKQPKDSGYRSVHLIYKFFSDKKSTHNGLRVELQFRSQLQHAWATAVETVGTFTRQALKSSQGEEDWLRFFALMGTAIAKRENSPPVPNTPSNAKELKAELREYAEKLDVAQRLQTFGAALQTVEGLDIGKETNYYLLELDPSAMKINVLGYKRQDIEKATKDYLEAEKNLNATSDAVLVSVESMASLRRAYPNYFLDTNRFVEAVNLALK